MPLYSLLDFVLTLDAVGIDRLSVRHGTWTRDAKSLGD